MPNPPDTNDAQPFHACRLEIDGDSATVFVAGEWRLANIGELAAAIARAGFARLGDHAVRIDGGELAAIDTAAALLLLRRLGEARIDVASVALDGFDARHQRIVALVRERLGDIRERRPSALRGMLGSFGAFSVEIGRLALTHLSFLGLTMTVLARTLLNPASLRRRELFAQLAQTCVTAIPVIALVMFLIGVVVAYLLGLQAAQYGANIFVVDGVALGMVREFSPLLVATIVAGRSGAAFTAQLGTMKLTEEIDAIRTLGLPPEQVLIVPRVLALVIALPVLVFVGSVFGLAGAAAICSAMLDITPASFVDRLQDSLAVRHYVIGLAKSPVFALFIAVIGCSMGVTVSRDTRSIGINTTSTVVQSIVVVILLDAFFAVLFQELEL